MGYDLKKGDRPRFVNGGTTLLIGYLNGGTTLFEHCPSLNSRSVTFFYEFKVCPPFKLFLVKKYKLEQRDDEKGLINTNWSSQKPGGYLKI